MKQKKLPIDHTLVLDESKLDHSHLKTAFLHMKTIKN